MITRLTKHVELDPRHPLSVEILTHTVPSAASPRRRTYEQLSRDGRVVRVRMPVGFAVLAEAVGPAGE